MARSILLRSKPAAVLALAAILTLATSAAGQAQQDLYAKSYALVIGIGKYPSRHWPNLPHGRKDAEGMHRFLTGQGFEVIPLYDEDATRARILQVMEDELAPKLRDDDRILVFYSGHGETKTFGGRDYGYIVPYDGNDSAASLISMEEIQTQSDKMGSARHQLFIMDACYGGQLAQKAAVTGIAPSHPQFIREVTRRSARQYLTAGGKDQQVLAGGPKGYSFFTGYLLEALEDGLGDLNGDGYVTLSELSAYLIPRATNSYQTPAVGTLPGHGLGEFLFTAPGGPVGQVASLTPVGGARDVVLKGQDAGGQIAGGQSVSAVPPPGTPPQSSGGTQIANLPTGDWSAAVLPGDRALIDGALAEAWRLNDNLDYDARRGRLMATDRSPGEMKRLLKTPHREIAEDELEGPWRCNLIKVMSIGITEERGGRCTFSRGAKGLEFDGEIDDGPVRGLVLRRAADQLVFLGATKQAPYSGIDGGPAARPSKSDRVALVIAKAADRVILVFPGRNRYEALELIR